MGERLVAKRSHVHGWGLFLHVAVPRHDMIVEYMGETVRGVVADLRERQYEEQVRRARARLRARFACLDPSPERPSNPRCSARRLHDGRTARGELLPFPAGPAGDR